MARADANVLANRWQTRKQPIPRRCAFMQPQFAGEGVGDGGTRTRDAIREPEHPDPAAGEHVMHGRRIDRIRRAIGLAVC